MAIHELPKSHTHNGMCIIHCDKKLAFINIPKNASTSIRLKLFSLGFKWGNIKNINPNEYFIFTIIREPIDRFVSQYLETVKRATGDCKIYGASLKPFYKIANPIEKFKQFITEEIQNGNLFEIHIQRQVWFLTDEKFFKVDKYIKIENLQQELQQISKQFDIPLNINHCNKKSPAQKAVLKKLLLADSNLSNIVRNTYDADIILYQNT